MCSLDVIKNALLTVSQNVWHFKAFKKAPPYIVWAEDGQADSVWADGAMQEQIITGTIDLYTKTLDNEPLFESIQNALNGTEISWRLNSIQYEDGGAGLLHYEWVWELG